MSNKRLNRERKFRKLNSLAAELECDILPQKVGVGRGYQLESLKRDVTESREGMDHVKGWDEFWKEICVLPDGTLDLEAIQRELSDYRTLLAFTPRIYDSVTGGMVSKPLTWPSVVISLADDHVNRLVEDAVNEAVEDFAEATKDVPWSRNDEATYDILCMVDHDIPIGVIPHWTDDEVKQAEAWASAVHLRASDNDDVIVPPYPKFLAQFDSSKGIANSEFKK